MEEKVKNISSNSLKYLKTWSCKWHKNLWYTHT